MLTNMHIINVSEKEERDKEAESLLKEVMAFPLTWGKETDMQIQ